MNKTKKLSVISAAILLLAGPAFGATYTDATGDGFVVTNWPHLDITSLQITNDATNISFKISLAGNPIAVNWGQYNIGVDRIPFAGATNAAVPPPPARPISMSVGGMDYWIRSWDGGAEIYHWDGGGKYWYGDWFTWNPPSDIQVPTKTTNSVTLTTTLASLGLAVGDSFYFDVYTTGGNTTDSAVDALANPNPTVAGLGDWVTPYDSGTNVYQYTVTGTAPVLTNAFGAAYSDATGDGYVPFTFPQLDIAACNITNDATNISFKIYLMGDPTGANNWGEYSIGINSVPGAGATSGTVPPFRPITMIAGGMDYWIRSWDSGAELYRWDASGPWWAQDSATWNPPSAVQLPVKTTNSVTLTTTLASLGLSAGSSFYFDVYTSGGGTNDSAVDALANPNHTDASAGDWVTPYDSGNHVFQYTVSGSASAAHPTLSNPKYAGTTFTVAVPTQLGFNYALEFKNSLGDASWTAVITNAGTGGQITMTNSGVGEPRRFYRVRVQ
jgi:hypothetical protein